MARKHLVGLIASLGLSGCENEDVCDGLRTFDPPPEPDPSASAPPVVIGGEWIGAGVLELSFSKPLLEGNAPDPARFAVLGWSARVQPYDSYAGPAVCYVRTAYSEVGQGYYYSSATITDVWIAPEDPTQLRLRMSNTTAACTVVPDTLGEGVMLVYTNGEGGNLLLDEEGEPVPDLGPAWAIQQIESCYGNGYYSYCSLGQTATGHLPALTSLAMIPCP